MNKRMFWSLLVATILIAGSVWVTGAIAGGNGIGPGMMGGYGPGPGMMNSPTAVTQTGPNTARPYHHGYYGRGPGMREGYGGYGMMGPGMMGGYGGYGMMGPGMMGGYGGYGMMGPGMMGGYGGYGMMGPGMMGGYGGYGMMGPGMMGPGMMGGYALGLSSDQRDKIASIWNSSMSKAWTIMGQLRDEYFQFSRLMYEENPDRAAINKAFTRISELQKRLLDLHLDARQQMMKVLTADQRAQLQKGF